MRAFRIRPAAGALAAAIALSLALVSVPSAAFAHAKLETAAPAAGATVASPSEIRLTFSEAVEPRFSGVTLTGPGGAKAPLGAPKVEGNDQRVLIAPIAKALGAGAYTVHWRAVSVDTHHTQGTFQFTVKP
jgi:methionine-rich copper-binding protein CopC